MSFMLSVPRPCHEIFVSLGALLFLRAAAVGRTGRVAEAPNDASASLAQRRHRSGAYAGGWRPHPRDPRRWR